MSNYSGSVKPLRGAPAPQSGGMPCEGSAEQLIAEPPSTDRGVEFTNMNEIIYQIHWLSVTVHAENETAFTLYDKIFKDIMGDLDELGNGGRGFKEIFINHLGVKLYINPSHGLEKYYHLEIPGQACETLQWENFKALGEYLETYFQGVYKVTRFDFAFDTMLFTPKDAENAIVENHIRTLAKRESLKIISSPFAKRDDGEIGTLTVYLGSPTSERKIRIYNKRGYTRLEFETKDKRSHLIARQVLLASSHAMWFEIVIQHLRDYIDFDQVWWFQFISSIERAYAKTSLPREVSLSKVIGWLDKQVTPALSVVMDVLPEDSVQTMINRGRKRVSPRYSHLYSCLPGRNHGEDEK